MKEKKEIFSPRTQPRIQKRFTQDNMSMKINFASGAHLRFMVGRSGEKLDVAFSSDAVILKQQSAALQKWLDYREGETNQHRFARLEKLVAGCSSGSDVITNLAKF